MTDPLADSPALGRPYCPGCEQNADPTREILDPRWCATHTPSWDGLDDARVTTKAILSGNAEAGGRDNASWCQAVHEEIPLEQGKRPLGRQPARRRP